MRIESTIRRKTGSTVIMGSKTYRFVAGDDGRHVCEVEDADHIKRLLSIPEGFKPAEAVPEKAEGEEKAPRAPRKAKPAEAVPEKAEG